MNDDPLAELYDFIDSDSALSDDEKERWKARLTSSLDGLAEAGALLHLKKIGLPSVSKMTEFLSEQVALGNPSGSRLVASYESFLTEGHRSKNGDDDGDDGEF